jgi:membrane protease YdiL (CAAX protease family)
MLQARSSRLSVGLIVALIIILVIQPTLYTLLKPHNVDTTTRAYWWLATGWVLLSIWLPFGILCLAVHSGKYKWQEVAGVDWHFFSRHRVACAVLLILFVMGAVIAPRLLYHGNPPLISPTYIFQPVSCAERLVFLVVAVSAGICEEVTYRGLPLRMLASSTGRAWAVLPITMVSFVFHHGPIGHVVFVYLIVGFVFGSIFIVLGRRHLEWLIILHAFYDAMFVFMP